MKRKRRLLWFLVLWSVLAWMLSLGSNLNHRLSYCIFKSLNVQDFQEISITEYHQSTEYLGSDVVWECDSWWLSRGNRVWSVELRMSVCSIESRCAALCCWWYWGQGCHGLESDPVWSSIVRPRITEIHTRSNNCCHPVLFFVSTKITMMSFQYILK